MGSVVTSVAPVNQTPASGSRADSSTVPSSVTAASLALVRCECGFQELAVSICPFASVTTTWDSPVVSEVTRNGMPERRPMPRSRTFTRCRSPRMTWSSTASSVVLSSATEPSSRTSKVRDHSSFRR